MADFERQQNFGGVCGNSMRNANFNASVDQANNLFGGWKNNDMLLSNNSSTYVFKKFANIHQLDGNSNNISRDFNNGPSSEGGLHPNEGHVFNMGINGPAWMSNAGLSNSTNWATSPTFDANNMNSENINADIPVINNFRNDPNKNNNFNMNNNFNGDFSGSPWNNRSANGNFVNSLNNANLLHLNNKARSVYQFEVLPYTFNMN